MDVQAILRMLLWLAALGGVVLIGTRVIGRVGARAAAAV